MNDFDENFPDEWLELVTLAMKSDVTKEQFKSFFKKSRIAIKVAIVVANERLN